MAVDDKGNPILVDANGKVAKDGNPYPDPNSLFAGTVAVAIGGYSSSVQGGYSVGIAGGSTSELASNSLAAGRQATATVANGVAIGYESTASVIDSSRAADTEGRIVSFGHRAGDIYYTVDYQNHTVTENTYDSDAYNRLVNVADGIDDHDVVVMEQLKNAKAEAVATAKNQIKVKGDETNVHAEETTDQDGVQTTTISLKPKVTLKNSTDNTGANQVVLDGTAGTITAGLSTDTTNFISLDGTKGLAKVGAIQIGNQSFTYDYMKPVSLNDDGATLNLESTRASATGNFVTGLSNRTWTPGNYVTGRAATEDELEQAGRHFLSIKTAYKDDDGNSITPTAENSLANYYNDGASGSASMAFGVGTTAEGDQSLSMGVRSSASGLNSLAIGYDNTASGTQSVAVGNGTNASGNFSVAMGLGAEAGTKNDDVKSTENGAAVAVGFGASAANTGSAAYGYYANAGAINASAFGTSASTTVEGGVALGAHSVANRDKGSTGYLAPDMTNPANAADATTWVSTSGAVSLGGADPTVDESENIKKITRQITNLAAGSEDSDAVNVAQLKALASQGMNFQGNDTNTSVHLDQGGTLQIQGSGRKDDTEYSTQNVKVLTDTANKRLSIALDKNPTFDSVTAGTENSTSGGGQAGSLKIVGANSSSTNKATTITAGYAASPELSGAKGTGRISYTDGDGTDHTVATLGDGLKLAGDTGTGSVALDNTLTVSGGATNLADGNNIGVTANESTLSLKLAKDITGLDTVTAGGVKMGIQSDGNDTTKSGKYVTGLDNTNWTVGQTQPVTGRAATEDQLQQVANAIVNGSATGGGFGLSADNADSKNATEVKQDLGSTIKITTDGDNNLTTTADSVKKAIVVSLNKDLNLNKATFTDGTSGATTIVDGNGIVVTPKQGADADKVKLTTDGLSNGGKQITNVQSGLYDTAQNKPVDISTITADSPMLQNGATIGDLQIVSNGVKTELTNKGLDFKGNGNTTVHRNLGETLTIQGTGADGRDYDGGANVQVKADKDANTLTVQLDRDLNAHTLTLGKASNGTETGEAGTLILNGKNRDNGMSPVSMGVTYRGNQNNEAMKTAMSRITYKGGNGNDHTVATLEDGLQMAGDNGEALNTTLDKKVTIKGGVAKDKLVDNTTDPTKNNNIGVVASQDAYGNTTLSLQLAKDIAGLNTVTAGSVVMGNQNVISVGKVSGQGSFITGLDNKTWDGTDYVSGRAATEDQLKKVSDSIQTSVNNAQFGITAGGLADGGDVTVKKNLGESIRIYGDAPVTNEKNDGSGDFWDRSKANILTKVKKDHNGEDYVSVELQDHLEVGVHGDGKTIEGTDGSMQFKGKSAKEVNITGDTGITLSDNGKKAAALRQADGAGYLDLTGTAGTQATVSVHTVAKNLAQQDQTRLTYTDQGNKAHEVATLEDGLIFAGDTDDNVSRTLNGTLKIYGGADVNSLSDGKNIGVVATSDGLQLKLSKNLTGIESVTGLTNKTWDGKTYVSGRAATEDQLFQIQGNITDSAKGGGFGLTADNANTSGSSDVKQNLGSTIGIHGYSNITTSVSDDGKSINIKLNNQVKLGDEGSISAGGVTINKDGINAGTKQITNVASGIGNTYDTTKKGQENWNNAANIGDVHTIVDNKVTDITKNVSDIKNDVDVIKKTGRTYQGDDKKTVKVDFAEGKFLSLTGGAGENEVSTENNIGVLSNGESGLSIRMAKNLKGLESVNTGNSTLNNDGLTINNSEGKAGTTITNRGIKIAANGDNTHDVEIGNRNVSMGGQQIHDVAAGTSATDAVNVGQLSMFANNVGSAINKLDNRVNRVGAGAAALAALHPLDFDPDDKWDFAGGFGHYKNANAAAIGAYYRPNEDTMFSIGGSFGGGENMLNAGVSFKLGQGNHVSTSRTMMAKEIESLKAVVKEQNEKLQENENLRAKVDKQDKEIAELKAMVQQLAARR